MCHEGFLHFLSSPDSLKSICHVITYIEVPFHIFGVYCIVAKTPGRMKNVKWNLLIMHFSIICLNLIMSFLLIPFMMVPALAGVPLGFLEELGVPQKFQMYLAVTGPAGTESATVYLFESRASINIDNTFRFTRARSRLIYYTGTLALNCMIYTLFIFKVPEDQEAAKLDILKFIPCPTREFITEPAFVPADQEWSNFMLMCLIPIFLAIGASQFLFFFSLSVYYLFVCKLSFSISHQTRKMQLCFFLGILALVLIPFVIQAFPYVVITVMMKNDKLTQAMTNIYFIVFGMHGCVGSVVILFVHKGYRNTIFRFF
ncbi:Protein CBG21825, partial [Caenorhabditis briggsae]